MKNQRLILFLSLFTLISFSEKVLSQEAHSNLPHDHTGRVVRRVKAYRESKQSGDATHRPAPFAGSAAAGANITKFNNGTPTTPRTGLLDSPSKN